MACLVAYNRGGEPQPKFLKSLNFHGIKNFEGLSVEPLVQLGPELWPVAVPSSRILSRQINILQYSQEGSSV
jgi:hypothetical protein